MIMAEKLAIGIDFGTDSCRSLVVDTATGKEIATHTAFYADWKKELYCNPAENQYRQHPQDHINALIEVVRGALDQMPANRIQNIVAKMYVDYVRVYQKGDVGEEFHGPELSTGLTDTAATFFKIHPNPTTNHVIIEGNFVPEKISIFNPAGVKVMEVYDTMIVDMSSLPAANYVLQIEIGVNEVEIHKVIKVK
jgi:hypothetical protein